MKPGKLPEVFVDKEILIAYNRKMKMARNSAEKTYLGFWFYYAYVRL